MVEERILVAEQAHEGPGSLMGPLAVVQNRFADDHMRVALLLPTESLLHMVQKPLAENDHLGVPVPEETVESWPAIPVSLMELANAVRVE